MADGLLIDLDQGLSNIDVDRPLPRRPFRALALALVLIAALAGDAGPAAPVFVILAAVPVSGAGVFALASDRVFVADSADGVVGEQTWHGEVLAYPLPGRSARWRTRVPQVPEQLIFVPGAGVVLAITQAGGAGAAQTIALDADTGRLLWSSATLDFEHAPGGGTGGLLLDRTASRAVVHWADLRTGRTIWSRAVPAGGTISLLYGASVSDPMWVVMEGPDGIDLIAEKTGAVITNAELSGSGLSGTGSGQPTLDEVGVVGDRVLVLRLAGQQASTLTAFDLATFTRQWTLSGDFIGYPSACGPMICLDGSRGLAGVDPATGTVVWHADRWESGQMIDPDLLLALGGQHGTNADVLDVRTGRTVVRMTGWAPVRDPVVGHGRLVVRPDPGKPESGWFAMIDPQYGAPAPLGELAGVTFQDCQTTSDLLACLTVHDTLRVWRFRQ